MPKYYVYNKERGELVHVHEEYDAESGISLRCTPEEVLEVIDETLAKEELEVLEVESESQQAEVMIRVNQKRELMEER